MQTPILVCEMYKKQITKNVFFKPGTGIVESITYTGIFNAYAMVRGYIILYIYT